MESGFELGIYVNRESAGYKAWCFELVLWDAVLIRFPMGK
jgi:hypothetical protein